MRISTIARATLCAGALLALPLAAGAAEITVWEHYDFSGASTVFNGASARLENGWNDRISSFRVKSGSWEICRDWDYRNCQIVGAGTDGEMSRLTMGWNDSISSLRPVGSAASGANADTVAQRLYSGILGRDGDPEGLRNAAAQIAAGRLTDLVAGMTQSQEFRSIAQQKSPADLLDQIYRGLLGRPADTAARTAYLPRIQRGDTAGVVLDIVNSEEFDGAGAPVAEGGSTAPTIQNEVRANGKGAVLWGGKKYFDTANAARVQFGSDGRYRITTNGSTNHNIEGSYTRESRDFVRINTIDVPERGTVQVDGGVRLDRDQLSRVDVTAGSQGTRDRILFHFVADGYRPPADESRCQEEIQARLQTQGAGDKFAFLPAERSRASSSRDRLVGEVVLLSQNSTAEYRCEVDARSGQVVDASVVASR
jgi:hypothetical protein